ncbi:hypothetical protein GQ43DRAFT_490038 [Delitschia confertaspora ATCC 74209]|uniref:Uncharacterized protein n=1 Tax=Delitschia confertaspora ATCC 74209 TaxID=1513339 RepID=A0A9P4MP25_9PLEO|nr:hypothetical protein GQ43DRAFT_490038 [Delitschia confertaspora ATCC 74209]
MPTVARALYTPFAGRAPPSQPQRMTALLGSGRNGRVTQVLLPCPTSKARRRPRTTLGNPPSQRLSVSRLTELAPCRPRPPSRFTRDCSPSTASPCPGPFLLNMPFAVHQLLSGFIRFPFQAVSEGVSHGPSRKLSGESQLTCALSPREMAPFLSPKDPNTRALAGFDGSVVAPWPISGSSQGPVVERPRWYSTVPVS